MPFNPPDGHEEYADSVPFQLGICQSLIEQVVTGTLSVPELEKRYTTYYPEARNDQH